MFKVLLLKFSKSIHPVSHEMHTRL